jgi:excisionase family DNA binding protein
MTNIVLSSYSLDDLQTLVTNVVKTCLSEWQQKSQPEAPPTEDNLTIDELAAYIGCSRVTIHKRKKEGIFPHYQVGRKVFFRKSEVDKVLRISGYGEKKGGNI